jgi:phage terminase large subunit-like protein
VDLGQHDDFTAWVLLWALDDGTCAVRARFWLPRAALETYPHRPYQEWVRAGLLDLTDGNTTDLDLVEEVILADAREAGVIEIGYDKRFAQHLALHLQGAGLTAVDCPQGFALNESIQSIAKLVADGALRHGDHAILSWMMDNTVLRAGRNREVRLDKEAAKDKIDGVAALVMANARRLVQPDAPSYQMFVFGGRP